MTINLRLDGRTALVTGSSRGIGKALALALAGQGARVAVHGVEPPNAVADEIKEAGGIATAFGADLGDVDACRSLPLKVAEGLGAIDILVLNASLEERAPWQRLSPDAADRQWAVNVRSGLLLVQGTAPWMMELGWGRIIGIGSIQQVRPNPVLLAYAATKAAQAVVIAGLAGELGRHGITANTLAPGAIATDRNAEVLSDAAYRRKVEERIPVGRIGEPDDCIGACLLLASDAGSYINGQTLFVDGGWHL